MSNKNQTAVEWLINEFSEILGPLETKPIQDLLMVDAIKQAKELEKQQQGYSEVFEWLSNKDYLTDKVDIIKKEFEQK
jgi:hypothetical protein